MRFELKQKIQDVDQEQNLDWALALAIAQRRGLPYHTGASADLDDRLVGRVNIIERGMECGRQKKTDDTQAEEACTHLSNCRVV